MSKKPSVYSVEPDPLLTIPILPSGWESARADELFTFITSGSRGWARYYSESGSYFLRVGNLDHGSISLDLSDIQKVEPPAGLEADRTRVRPGDILISITADVGMVGLVPPTLGEAFVNQHVAIARPSKEINTKYLSWFLASQAGGQRQFRDLQRGATKSGLGLDDIRAVVVPMAPLEEQRRIVATIEENLSRLDSGLSALDRTRAKLSRYRAAVLKAACEGRLVPTEAELARAEGRDYEPADRLLARVAQERRARWEADQFSEMAEKRKRPTTDNWKRKYQPPSAPDDQNLAALPEGWMWCSALGLCFAVDNGNTPPPERMHQDTGDVPFIKVYNLTMNGDLNFNIKPTYINYETHNTILKRSRISPGEILMNIVGPPLGKVSIVPDTYPEWNTNQAVVVFRPMPGINRKYFCYCLMTEHVRSWATSQAKATAGQFNISVNMCRNLPIPLPPLAEQARIVAEVERRLSLIDALELVVAASLKRSGRLRQSILKRSFEGKLVPQDPADEPASALLERIRRDRPQAGGRLF